MSPHVAAGLALALTCLVFPATASDVVDAIALDAAPERMAYQPPRYPADQAAKGVAADVRMVLVIDLDGSVRAIENVETAQPEFVDAARTAAEKWRFQGGSVAGQPTRYRLPVTVLFRPEDEQGEPDTIAVGGGLVVVAGPAIEWEVAPAYPAELAQDPRDGIAVVNLHVDAVGVPSDAVVEYASHAAFATAAAEAVLGWKFKPAEGKGGLVSARTQVTVRFRKTDATLTAADRKRRAQLEHSLDYDVAPEESVQVPLVYPFDALLKGERGTSSLNLFISPEGQVVSIEPDPGSTGEFALAAGACVSSWTFNPATKDGEPVFGWVKWQLVFADDSGELQWDDTGRELLAALRAGTFKSTPQRELDKPLTPRERIPPRLPPGLGAAAVGDVVVEAIVDRNGRVQFPRVITAPVPSVGYAAATAALRWRFESPRKGGEPVHVRVRIPFKINAAPPEASSGGDAPAPSAPRTVTAPLPAN